MSRDRRSIADAPLASGPTVLFVSPVDHRMNSPKVVHFANWLATEQRVTVHFLTLQEPKWLETPVIFHDLGFNGRCLRRYSSSLRTVLHWARRCRPDILIAVNDPGVALCAWVRILTGRPFAVLAQEHTNIQGRLPRTMLNAWHHRRAACVFDISPAASEWRRRCMRLRALQGAFLNVPPLRPAPRRRPNTGELGSSRNPLSICYCGQISQRACILEFIESLVHQEHVCDVHLYGPGDSEYCRKAVSMAEGSHINVTHHGRVPRDELWVVYQRHHVGLVLARMPKGGSYGSPYCCPNKLFEYAAAGLAILASRQPSIVQWLTESGAGVTVDPDDRVGVAAAIDRLCKDGTASEMGQNGYRMHQRHWNMETEAARAWNLMLKEVPKLGSGESPS